MSDTSRKSVSRPPSQRTNSAREHSDSTGKTARTDTSGETWVTDLRPTVNRSGAGGSGTVRFTPYRLGTRRGYLLSWVNESGPPLTLPLHMQGWYEIHLGFLAPSGLRIRISGEAAFRWVESSTRWDWKPGEGEEAFWKIAELSGKDLELLPLPLPRSERRHNPRESAIAYLRLVPLSPQQAGRRIHSWRNAQTHTAGAVIDGDLIGAYAPGSPDEVRAMIEPFVRSDFRRIFWGCTVTSMRMNYLTRVGYWIGKDQEIDSMHSPHFRRSARVFQQAVFRHGNDIFMPNTNHGQRYESADMKSRGFRDFHFHADHARMVQTWIHVRYFQIQFTAG